MCVDVSTGVGVRVPLVEEAICSVSDVANPDEALLLLDDAFTGPAKGALLLSSLISNPEGPHLRSSLGLAAALESQEAEALLAAPQACPARGQGRDGPVIT